MLIYGVLFVIASYVGYAGYKAYNHCVENEYGRKLRNIDRFVVSQGNRGLKRIKVDFEIVHELILLSLLQYLNKSVVPISENRYKVSYILEGKKYVHLVSVYRGPSSFSLALDADRNKDITDIVNMYAGPDKTFENKFVTPSDLGIDGLKNVLIVYADGGEKLFQSKEYLDIDQAAESK